MYYFLKSVVLHWTALNKTYYSSFELNNKKLIVCFISIIIINNYRIFRNEMRFFDVSKIRTDHIGYY
jgi:hypothetical protein